MHTLAALLVVLACGLQATVGTSPVCHPGQDICSHRIPGWTPIPDDPFVQFVATRFTYYGGSYADWDAVHFRSAQQFATDGSWLWVLSDDNLYVDPSGMLTLHLLTQLCNPLHCD